MSIQNAVSNDYSRLVDYASTPDQIKSVKNHIAKSIQDGMLPAFKGIPLITSLNTKLGDIQKAEAMRSGLVPNQPTIAQNALASAQPQGIDAAQSNLPESYAGGGIIAFANEGLVDGEAQLPEGGVYPEEEEEEEQGISPLLGSHGRGAIGAPVTPKVQTPIQAPQTQQSTVPPAPVGGGRGIGTGISLADILSKMIPKTEGGSRGRGAVPPTPATPATPAPAEAKKALTPDEIAAGAKISGRPSVAHTVVAAPAAAPIPAEPTPSIPPMSSDTDTLKEMQDKMVDDREGLKQLVLGSDDSENKMKMRALLALMQGGFKAAAGTSPYAAVNIGAGGEEGAKAFAEGIAQIDADKRNKVAQLVSLGLKGQELDNELVKMGITRDYYNMHKASLDAEAAYKRAGAAHLNMQTALEPQKLNLQRQRIIAAGVAKPLKVSSADIKAIDDQVAGWKSDVGSSPFADRLSPMAKKFADPKYATSSPKNYAIAMREVNTLADEARTNALRQRARERAGQY